METKEIIQLIKNNFQNVTSCNESILKGETRYQERITSIFYFDYSQKVMDPSFDLNEYQEHIVAKDYYNYKGDLQWNLYSYFICDLAKIDENIKKVIESNTVFTRKYVVTPDYFLQLINKKTGKQIIQYAPKEDINTLWMNNLRGKDLDGVYLDKTYKDVIEQYLAGKPIKESEGIVYQSIIHEPEKLAFADKIKLKSFRNFPKEFNFIFKKVNLIKGPNGCGKTSLLESIELCLCGKTNRNKKVAENAEILLTFRDGRVETYERDNNAKHLARDLLWYGNMAVRVNKLCESFNRYNLYDADAAYRLSTSTKLKDIQDAFYSLALGQNANIIDERLNKFLEKFHDIVHSYEKDIESLSSLIRAEERTLEEISKLKDNPTAYFDLFVNETKHKRWKGILPVSMDDNSAIFETNCSEAEILIKELQQKINWVEGINNQTLRSEREKYNKLSEIFSNYLSELAKEKAAARETEAKLKELQHKDAILKESLSYVTDENIDLLIGFEDKINKTKYSRDKCKIAKELAKNFSLDLIDDKKANINEYEDSLVKLVNSNNDKFISLIQKIEVIKLTVSKSESIIEEIKVKGMEFLNMHMKENSCPLCKAKYEREELISRVKAVHGKSQGEEVLEGFLRERSELEKRSQELENKTRNLQAIKKAVVALFEHQDYSMLSFDKFFNEIERLNLSYANFEDDLNKFLGLKEKFLSKGLNEKDLLRIKDSVIFYFPSFTLEFKNKAKFIELSQTVQKDIDSVSKKLTTLHLSERSLAENNIKKISDQVGISYEDPNVIGKEIEVRKSSLNYAMKYSEKLLQFIDFSEIDKFEDLSLILKHIKSIFDKFKNSFDVSKQNSIMVSEAIKKLDEFRNRLAEIKTLKGRADNAVSGIEDIFNNYNKNRYLEEFLNVNNDLIVGIFREIHSPREFSNINFDNVRGEEQISLEREKIKEPAPLTQISSGQRSALSIAIFLALNKTLKNGPPFIILDDPVAHVDDLNILSFLDFLRDLVIYDNKQIFFATADKKIASFFEKKFSFLDNEFQSINLSEFMGQRSE